MEKEIKKNVVRLMVFSIMIIFCGFVKAENAIADTGDIFLETFGQDQVLSSKSYEWYRGDPPLTINDSQIDPVSGLDNEGEVRSSWTIYTGRDTTWHLDGDYTTHSTIEVQNGKLHLRQYIKDGRPDGEYFHGTNFGNVSSSLVISAPIEGLDRNTRLSMDLSLIDYRFFAIHDAWAWAGSVSGVIRITFESGSFIEKIWSYNPRYAPNFDNLKSFDFNICDNSGSDPETCEQALRNERSVEIIINLHTDYLGTWDCFGYAGLFMEVAVDNIRLYSQAPIVTFLDGEDPSRTVTGASADGASEAIIQIENVEEEDNIIVTIPPGNGDKIGEGTISNGVFSQVYRAPDNFTNRNRFPTRGSRYRATASEYSNFCK